MRDPRYDILFEPVKIGPVTAPNRFYQVPHCTGMGWLRPNMLAAMRGIKAEGGWGVVCTEYCSIHQSSDDIPYPTQALWGAEDIKAHRRMTDLVHDRGALAGVELWHGGSRVANLMTREVPVDVRSMPNWNGDPVQSRAMDRHDIQELKRWHRNAARRAVEAGFDIVYVYATHHYLIDNFLDPALNTRRDEYGGSQENRMRLLRELIEETKEAVGDKCAVAVRYSTEDGGGPDGSPVLGDRLEIFEALAELPDLWDINIRDYSLEMGVSRFVAEGALEAYMANVKSLTTKPVVTVGRFTSPDSMLGQVQRGIVDLIGAARPSIADPFLPRKIAEGRLEDIRECIGCNICYTGDSRHYPIRCTQNPTMGEEWRRGWHPERIEPRTEDESVLVVGAGPAGLEAARALGQRGYRVMLAEAGREPGGRVTKEAALPGLAEWARVRDHRLQQFLKLPNVELYLDSPMTCADVLATGADHVAIATGARWRRDGIGSSHLTSITDGMPADRLFTPDDIMEGRLPDGHVLVFDDDGFYMASVLAEKLRQADRQVSYLTPSSMVSPWSVNNAEQVRVHRRLDELGMDIVLNRALSGFDGQTATTTCSYTGREARHATDNILLVTSRIPVDGLYHDLQQAMETGAKGAPRSLKRIGDAEAPSIIAAAVYAGHKYARELGTEIDRDLPIRQERVEPHI